MSTQHPSIRLSLHALKFNSNFDRSSIALITLCHVIASQQSYVRINKGAVFCMRYSLDTVMQQSLNTPASLAGRLKNNNECFKIPADLH